MKKQMIGIAFMGLGIGTAAFACELLKDMRGFGAPSAYKLFHVKGTHTCQSDVAIGGTCAVDVRDALDCANGHHRNKANNCCKNAHNTGRSIGYTPGACSPLF